MDDRDRLKQLRALRDQLTRLPPSAERDRMLREVGGRAADLENHEAGARVRTAQPVAPAEPPVQAALPPRRERPAPARTQRASTRGAAGRAHSLTEAASAFTASVRPTPELPEGLRLSLDDNVATDRDRPWIRGLRG